MQSLLWFLLGVGLTIAGQAIATDYTVYPNGSGNSVIYGSDGSETRVYGNRYTHQAPGGGLTDGQVITPYPKNPC